MSDKGFVAGPYLSPLTDSFHANSILAIPQPGKLNVCLNVTLLASNCLNGNIVNIKLEN
jgi:hypothetical protein